MRRAGFALRKLDSPAHVALILLVLCLPLSARAAPREHQFTGRCDACHLEKVEAPKRPPREGTFQRWNLTPLRLLRSHPVNAPMPVGHPDFHAPPLDAYGAPQVEGDAGVATGGSTTELENAARAWGDQRGLFLKIVTGANAGRVRQITGGDATRVRFAALPAPVDAGTGYEIDRDGNRGNDLLLSSAGGWSRTDGSVTCGTCHDPRSPNPTFLRRAGGLSTCSACHRQAMHDSATLGGAYGVWGEGFTCMTCHRPHDTPNVALVRETVEAPDGVTRTVSLERESGPRSFADGEGALDGICEVCHTRTTHFRNDGLGPDQDHGGLAAQDCRSCHLHELGFAPACQGCHLPKPGDEDYPGGGGAHEKHVVGLGYGCAACHRNNDHNEGEGVFAPENVDFDFGPRAFPGGTTADNGLAPSATRDAQGLTCSVGCHNPVVGDEPALSNAARWGTEPLACTACHERQGAAMQRGTHGTSAWTSAHPYDQSSAAAVRGSCGACHESQSHSGGTVTVRPVGGVAFALTGAGPQELDPLCRSCHLATGAPLVNALPPKVFGFMDPAKDFHGTRAGTGWGGTLAAPYQRGQAPLPCASCHDHHAGQGAYLLRGQINGRTVASAPTRIGRGGEAVCASCHQGNWHAGCLQSGCHSTDPLPAPAPCFYCHTHQGVVNFLSPDDCDHCHGGWFPRGLENDLTAPRITSGPAATVRSGGATITWQTDQAATSVVEWWSGPGDVRSAIKTGYVTSHSVVLTGAQVATTYTYRVRSADRARNEVASAELTFSTPITDPPPAPNLVDEPNIVGAAATVVQLAWVAALDPNGDPVEYEVEVDDAADFTSVNARSIWVGALHWTVTLDTGRCWYWRVRARDGAHPGFVSSWSAVDGFCVMRSAPPPAPVLVPEPDFAAGYALPITLEWSASPDPEGNPVEYQVVVASSSSGWPDINRPTQTSPWLTTRTWTPTIPGYTSNLWRVKARDATHPEAESPWSALDDFSDTAMSSCPLVYTWDGARWRFATDIQGQFLGPPDNPISRAVPLFQPAYVPLEGLVPQDDGRLRVKVWETLSEISYFDEVRLLAIDHPAERRIASSRSESTYGHGYVEPLRFVAYGEGVAPRRAVDQDGRDVLEHLLEVDDSPAPASYERLVHYELDFPPIDHPEHARLVFDGWSIYGGGDPTEYLKPKVEFADDQGGWTELRTFGSPAGDLKTVVIQLPPLPLKAGRDWVRLRVHLGQRRHVRWAIDRLRLDDAPPIDVTIRELPVARAELAFRGRSEYDAANLEHRLRAPYQAAPADPQQQSWGRFTRYGEVGALLEDGDDRFVVMNHGDELTMEFEPIPVAPGSARTYVLKADVPYKPRGPVEPLPYAGMERYPPAEEKAIDRLYLDRWNTREVERAVQAVR